MCMLMCTQYPHHWVGDFLKGKAASYSSAEATETSPEPAPMISGAILICNTEDNEQLSVAGRWRERKEMAEME